MTTHTPGPWIFRARDEQTNPYWRIGEIKAGALLVAECGLANVNGQGEANARLIAAAPDLLRILQKITNAHNSGNNGAFMGEATLCQAFATEANEAIAKATK